MKCLDVYNFQKKMLFSIYIVQGKRDKVMVVESRWRVQVFIVPSNFSVPFDIFQIKHLEQNYQGFLQMNALWPRAPGYSPRLTAPAQPGDAPSLRPRAVVYRHSPDERSGSQPRPER